MELFLTKLFENDYKKLPKFIQKRCDKQLLLLLKDFSHPSLQTKKIQGVKDIWEGRISKGIRFTFQIAKNIYIIRRIGKHNQVLRRP